MKIFQLAVMMIFCWTLMSCGGKTPARPEPILTPEQIRQNSTVSGADAIPPIAAGAAGVKHYICPNGHPGADAEGTCAQCGSALVHNQAYHDQGAVQQTTQPVAGQEPPQNAAGIWHYTCSNGCEGGAGSAVACAKCGNTLVHNQAYHQ